MVRNAKRAHFEKVVQNNNNDTASIWQAINEFSHTSRKSSHPPCGYSADDLNTHFLAVDGSVGQDDNCNDSRTIMSALSQFCRDKLTSQDTCTIPALLEYEVGKYISRLKNKKSMGPDNLNDFLLKMSLLYTVQPLTYIYNLCINQARFPRTWKLAKVIPLPKTKNTNDLNNFRPISLLSVLSKPLEKHIQKHVTEFVESHNLYHIFQSGFRKKHSCHSALVHMCDTWLSAINNHELAGAVFLDFKKAFDLVDHGILIKKLRLYLHSSHTVSLLQSFLSCRSQRVFINGKYSQQGHLSCGVPQGSVLGPLLFCLFINDLPLHLTNPNVICDLFADDSSLHTHSTNLTNISLCLQDSLDNVIQWCKGNNMVLHPGKTKAMIITTRQKHQLQQLNLNVRIGSDFIEQVENYRLLGITIDNELKWDIHVNRICKTVSRNIYLLKKLAYFVSQDACKLFFDAHCLSHINYASTVWSGAKQCHISKLNTVHRRGAKILLKDTTMTTDDRLKKLGLLSLKNQFDFNTSILFFKVLFNLAPPYLEHNVKKANGRYDSNRYIPARPRIDLFKSSFAFSGPSIWNSLPRNVRASSTLSSFKTNLRSFLLTNQ